MLPSFHGMTFDQIDSYLDLQDQVIDGLKSQIKEIKQKRWANSLIWAYRIQSIRHPRKARRGLILVHNLFREKEFSFFEAFDEISKETETWKEAK
jgi:hypothetical protein